MRKKQPQAYRTWVKVVTQKMPHLSKPQAVVLAMWSFGIALTHSCGLTTVSVFLAQLLGRPEAHIREQLRQWYREESNRGGRKRSQIEASKCFSPLLKWVLSQWSNGEKRLVLAADASTLGQRFTLLVISVVYRGCGIPVAWKVVRATEKGSWQPHWRELLKALKGAVPEDWFVLVTTDRGLYAKWFYEAIQALHWHPFMRINARGFYQLQNHTPLMPLNQLLTGVGQHWAASLKCFKNDPLSCTLLARWDEGYTDPWLIVTDLTPLEADIYWYAMRSWIECLFKDIKRGGLGWHHTKMTDPQRVERLWLAIAVATFWLVSVGGESETQLSPCSLESSHLLLSKSSQNPPPPSPPRWLSCFRRGFLVLLATAIQGFSLPLGCLAPECFPVPDG